MRSPPSIAASSEAGSIEVGEAHGRPRLGELGQGFGGAREEHRGPPPAHFSSSNLAAALPNCPDAPVTMILLKSHLPFLAAIITSVTIEATEGED